MEIMKKCALIYCLLITITGALGEEPSPAIPGTASLSPNPASGPITRGQRIFSTGHSFHAGFPPILTEISKSAGFADYSIVGISNIGGSKTIQHWDGKAGQAELTAGAVDVLMTTPIYLPDPGVENFARLGFEHNPNFRLTMMEFWLPFDQYEPRNYVGGPEHLAPPAKVDHNAATGENLPRSTNVISARWMNWSAASIRSWASRWFLSCRSVRP